MSENTKEQLKMGIYESSNDLANIETIDGRPFAELMYKDDAERVIECYNALAGIEDPAALLAEVREAIGEAVRQIRRVALIDDVHIADFDLAVTADRLAALSQRLGARQ